MKLVTAQREDALIVRVTGDVDHHSAPGLREAIDEKMESLSPREIILDLSGTDFMDSSGLGLILGRLRKTRERGIRLTLFHPTPAIRKILHLAGVEESLNIVMRKEEEQ
ncbi:MAG: STAS domain-containing protein [Clostridia bacterium]|nr:STAS domain-containing protein [Clostridia bacterium]